MITLGYRIARVFEWTIAVAAVASKLSGQTAPAVQRATLWGTIALGQAGITDSGMIHSSIGLSVQRHHLLVTGRATENQQGQKGDYRMRIRDVGILAGYATTPPAQRVACVEDNHASECNSQGYLPGHLTKHCSTQASIR